ncbi:unnamed protein product [Gongylonema pulchrum]|uniref:CA domain-containing protein n=1 Tax=Gongylonema pulchrum TaxID=637853 RepID=A0A183DDM2_9BILA|nr:unnamed protein product [Gongylonema pulchrum]
MGQLLFVESFNSASQIRMELIDGDLYSVGSITYGFANSVNSEYLKFFDIDPGTGVITAISALDREIHDYYELPVMAVDAAGHTAKAKAVIDVVDVNDNAPLFEQNALHLRIAEDEAPGKELLKLKAYGGDANETITYTLQASTDILKYLNIDSGSGEWHS